MIYLGAEQCLQVSVTWWMHLLEYLPKNLHSECCWGGQTITCQRQWGLCSQIQSQNPFPSGYRPELDVTNELSPELALWFMQMIGILHWAVELGYIDVFLEASLLSQYQANPQPTWTSQSFLSYLHIPQETSWYGMNCLSCEDSCI